MRTKEYNELTLNEKEIVWEKQRKMYEEDEKINGCRTIDIEIETFEDFDRQASWVNFTYDIDTFEVV